MEMSKAISRAAKLIAKKGGDTTLKRHGKKHFKLMAKKRWAKVAPKQASKK